jgi:hypothetical protein
MGKLTEQDHKKGDNWQSPLWVSLQNKTIERETTNNYHYGQTDSTRPQRGRHLTITTMGKLTEQDHSKGDTWQSPLWVSLQNKTIERETTNNHHYGQTYSTRPQKGRHLIITTMGKLTTKDQKGRYLTITTMGKLTAQDHKKGDS